MLDTWRDAQEPRGGLVWQTMADGDDSALVLRARQGDTEAFGTLVERHQRSVFNVCYRLAGERREAEDLAQEAFIRAYERLDRFDLERPFGPWVRRVATNVCLNRLQRAKPVQVPLDEERDQQQGRWGADPQLGHEDRERAALLRAAILALPAHYRAIIELRHFQELSYDAIAEELAIPLSDVKSHLFRARKQLARLLSKEDIM